MASLNFGIYRNVSGLLMGDTLLVQACVSLHSQDLFGIITRDYSAWFFSQYAMHGTVSVLQMLSNMAATMTVAC